MENSPLVSVGIPTYNRPKSLIRTLNSILHQTYKNLEIIISDNCSTNADVEKIVMKLCSKDSRIKYFRQKKNMEAAYNFNFVKNNSNGKYFMWLADDDWLDYDYF